jgi:hypothetical protein
MAKLRGRSPQANYTDRATAVCRRTTKKSRDGLGGQITLCRKLIRPRYSCGLLDPHLRYCKWHMCRTMRRLVSRFLTLILLLLLLPNILPSDASFLLFSLLSIFCIYFSFCYLYLFCGVRGSIVVMALCYKPEGRGIASRWGRLSL